ncbi:MAG: lysophospholipid acyltransferase family protein [Candidatus Hydrogenedentes bacterium]|nr:lysophospholipid acyltransferase family protein [Candidatus Hydrogenedentota bacterium]
MARRSRLARAVVAGATRAFIAVTSRTPLKLNRAIAVCGGRALARCVPRVYRVARANLELAYGDSLSGPEKHRILRGCVDNLALVAAEFGHLQSLAREQGAGRALTVEGAEFIERGRGYLCIGAHLGNWELMAPCMAASGYPVAEVVRPFDDPGVDRVIDGIRTAGGIVTIPKDRAGGEILNRLKAGYLVGILADQSPRDNGVPVTFFGAPCWATVGPVMIAVRAKVPVVPVALVRRADGGYVLRFYPPITMSRTGDLRADLRENTQKCQDAIEAMVREYPAQWLWLHRRWKERPRLAREWAAREKRDR